MELTREHASLMGVLQMFLAASSDVNRTTSSEKIAMSESLTTNNASSVSPEKPVPMDIVEVH